MCTIFILIDAFRPDYIEKSPFIKRLSETSLWGTLIPPFGFMSTTGAIFAGLDPQESNLCHKFCLNQESSPFNFIKGLPGFMIRAPLQPARGIGKLLISLLLRIKQKNIVSYYGSPEMIPVALLPLFDFGEKKRPDEHGFVPGLSLFDILTRENKKYLYLGFARKKSFREYTRKFIQNQILKKRYDDDRYLIETFKKDISKNNYDFIYLHLNLLDALGHYFGPDSKEVGEGIKRIDIYIEALYNLLKDRFQSLNFVLASDHGMTEVKGSVDIWNLIQKSKLKAGSDFIPFLDATQARFWSKDYSKQYIKGMLSELKGGRFLNQDDFIKFSIKFKDNRYGELFWVCEEGVIISPNFFDEKPLKGAHGYIPGSKGDLAFFLIDGKDIKPGRKNGNLKDIFSLLSKLIS